MATAGTDKIIFANQLRGLCVLSVMLVHYTTVVHYMRANVAWVIAAPPLNTPISPVALWVYPPWLDLGKFGVGAFFLISGFVIPFSLKRSGVGTFLMARFLRIYPTFWLALLVEAAIIAASGHYWHRMPAYGWRDYLVNGLLIETPLNRPTVDWVSWTLSVEIKFYLVAAILRTTILHGRILPLLGLAASALGINVLQGRGLIHLPPILVSEFMYLGYILIGTLFHFHYLKSLSTGRLVTGVVVLTVLFFASFALGPSALDARSPHTASFAIAIVVFSAGYAMRRHFGPNRILDGLAAISYPLYLIHATFGFTVISFLIMAWHLPYWLAAFLSAGLAFAVAIGLHRAIERPTTRLGHRLRRNWRASAGCGRLISRPRAGRCE